MARDITDLPEPDSPTTHRISLRHSQSDALVRPYARNRRHTLRKVMGG